MIASPTARDKQSCWIIQGDHLVWKDADPDVPILKQAKAEYAKLE